MSDRNQIKLSEIVVLIDAAFLNYVLTDIKRYFEKALGRTLNDVDITMLSTYLCLDAKVSEGANDIQFLFIYDEKSTQLVHCHPSDLEKDLNGVAFKSSFGECSFASVPSEGMVTREDLFLDLLTIISDSADVKKMIIISFNEEYGEKVISVLRQVKNKDVVQFRMNEPERAVNFQWEMLGFPLMQALGIKADEL